MHRLAVASCLLLLSACASSSDATPHGTSGASSGSGGASAGCTPCIKDSDCGSAARCGQFAGDTYCATDCSSGQACPAGTACTSVNSAEGTQVSLCVPTTDVCGGSTSSAAGSGGAATASTGSGEVCGTLIGPDMSSCCSSCTKSGKPCQANGCYGGWWCNAPTCSCQPPPSSCGSSGAGGAGTGGSGTGGSVTTLTGAKLDSLSFGIVGDTRPATEDDTSGYPTAVISKIWNDLQSMNPPPAFAVSTGDYMFANPYGSQGAAQLDIYLNARSVFKNGVFPAMGNHECTGGTASNCGPGSANGETNNYKDFMSKMLQPLGVTTPYYEVDVTSTTANAWTAKFLIVAANAWNSAQASWLSSAMAKSTTYTFVVRHEGSIATTAPGVVPSGDIIAQYPYTMLIVGHTHTFEYFASEKQTIVGNGGAPLSSSINYGYVVATQRSDGAIVFRAYDYASNSVIKTFAVKPDGTPTP